MKNMAWCTSVVYPGRLAFPQLASYSGASDGAVLCCAVLCCVVPQRRAALCCAVRALLAAGWAAITCCWHAH
jgi:hypothetical protein